MTQQYIGTKIVTAWPCKQLQDDSTARDGYAVKYADGYTSWSPADVFEAAYLPLGVIESLPSHQQRVIGERAELDDRLSKRSAFTSTDTFAELSEEEQELLHAQSAAMQDYLSVLDDRIALFQDARE